MASNSASTSSAAPAAVQEFRVRVPKNVQKKYSVIKFNPSNKVDFTKCGKVQIGRENNVKEYKLSHDLELMPKFGAGSEFGREQKEEARRKKYGVLLKKYNPEHQPWLMKVGDETKKKKFKGTRDGGVCENASYYVFTQCDDGAFEAYPVEEWYNFNPVLNYNYLNAEEAEAEFIRRDQTLNYFSVMVKKRLTGEDEAEEDEEDSKKGKKQSKKKKEKDFKLTDLDEWAILTDDEEDDDDDDDDDEDGGEEKKKKKENNTGKKKKKGKKSKEHEVKDEAFEESDDLDEGAEVEYMTDTDSEDEDMYADDTKVKSEKYEEMGVEDEDGLRNVIESGDEEEEEEKPEEKEDDEEEDEEGNEKKDRKGKESESESSGSSSDSDPENDTNIKSALFMQKRPDKKSKKGGKNSGNNSRNNSRPNTPTIGAGGDASGTKKKADDNTGPPEKRIKLEEKKAAVPTTSTSSGGVTLEDSVKRYLSRKPMTVKDLLQKLHKSQGGNKEELVSTLGTILKKTNPSKVKVEGKLHLFIKRT